MPHQYLIISFNPQNLIKMVFLSLLPLDYIEVIETWGWFSKWLSTGSDTPHSSLPTKGTIAILDTQPGAREEVRCAIGI